MVVPLVIDLQIVARKVVVGEVKQFCAKEYTLKLDIFSQVTMLQNKKEPIFLFVVTDAKKFEMYSFARC